MSGTGTKYKGICQTDCYSTIMTLIVICQVRKHQDVRFRMFQHFDKSINLCLVLVQS